MNIQERNKLIEKIKNSVAQQQGLANWDEMLDESNGCIYDSMIDGVLEVALKEYGSSKNTNYNHEQEDTR